MRRIDYVAPSSEEIMISLENAITGTNQLEKPIPGGDIDPWGDD